jgi:exopolyphosphatase/guanosine-5'-triphosphate,3'-diphosphate pyrophosphatase
MIDPGGSEVLAAVDLGSNSFHMLVARFDHGQLTTVDRLREMVRLGGGLDARQRLSASSQRVALACLRRFGERLRAVNADKVRVVGTNTLRRARGKGRFLQQAERALGHPVEIISGIEEARLVYLGASHHLPRVDGPKFVVDIGGGSTELIVGRGLEPVAMESIAVGCVSLGQAAFPDGRLSAKNFAKARIQVRLELEPVRQIFRRYEPVQIAGTAGSIRAAHSVLTALDRAPQGITAEGLEYLIDEMIAFGQVAKIRLPELSAERAEVFPAGVAILVEVMRAMALPRMCVADGALREGILYDLVGRLTDEDSRVRTVRAMAARYHADPSQAGRVAATTSVLFRQVCDDWDLDADHEQLLGWAAQLHELGLDIAHAHYHRHGAYVLENADMPGFPREEQRVLARLVLGHRRSFERESFQDLPPAWQRPALRLTLLLRLAVLFHRSRIDTALPDLRLRVHGRSMEIQLPTGWLASNPLTLADLERERTFLASAGCKLTIRRRN